MGREERGGISLRSSGGKQIAAETHGNGVGERHSPLVAESLPRSGSDSRTQGFLLLQLPFF